MPQSAGAAAPLTSARVRRVEDRLEGLEGRLLLLLHRRLERLQPDGEALDGIVRALLRARELRAVRGAEALLEGGDALLGERRHLRGVRRCVVSGEW